MKEGNDVSVLVEIKRCSRANGRVKISLDTYCDEGLCADYIHKILRDITQEYYLPALKQLSEGVNEY
jgi:hypothetical protein